MGEIPLGVFHVRPSLQAICAAGFLKPVYHDSTVFTTQEAAKLSRPVPLVRRCVASWRMGSATAPAGPLEGILADLQGRWQSTKEKQEKGEGA